MKTLTRTTGFVLSATLVLLAAPKAQAIEQKTLLLPPGGAPDCHSLPKFGFSSYTIYGYGERVTHVQCGGLAAQMGLETGDIILEMNGRPLTFHGAWDRALHEALANSGWVHLKIRDVNTGRIAHRDTHLACHGPVTPKSHIVGYGNSGFGPHSETSGTVPPSGPITHKSIAKGPGKYVKSNGFGTSQKRNQLGNIRKLFGDIQKSKP